MKNNEIISTREIPYKIDDVFKMRSDEDKIKIWWWPVGFTNTFSKFEFKNWWKWDFVMHWPNWVDYENKIIFLEIIENKFIKLNHIVAPFFIAEVNFENKWNNTKITFKMIFESEEVCQSVKSYAWNWNEENFDRLEEILKKFNS